MIKKYSWDFVEVDTKYSTHCFHTYPAMMVPHVADQLIKRYGTDKSTLFDPYCGTGTSLVEANSNGLNAIGTDLNPLARLIAKAKTDLIKIETLDSHIKNFYSYLFQFRFGLEKRDSFVPPQFPNISFWFSKSVIVDLAILKKYIDGIKNTSVSNFFKVAFSQTIRECSRTRKNEFKLYKMSTEQLKHFKPDVFATFEKIVAKNRAGLLSFCDKKKNGATSKIYDFNTVKQDPSQIIKQRIGIVVTSPPYGDSQTTVAYGQFSKLANQWLGSHDANKLDYELMGGKRGETIKKFKCKILNNDLLKIQKIDKNRALDVSAFYEDYEKSIGNVSKVLMKRGYACYVVSNRCVKGVTLPTHQITKEFFEENGFKHIGTFERKISNKRLPRKNSPSGVSGKKRDLMNIEYIVVMQKK